MSTELLNQIKAYTAEMDAEQGSVTVDEVALRIEAVRELPVERPRPQLARGLWVTATAAAVVVALVALPLLLRRAEPDPPPATAPTMITTEAPTLTTATPPTIVESSPQPPEVEPGVPLWESTTATIPVVRPQRDPADPPYVGNDTSLGVITWSTLEGNGAGIPSVNADINGYVISGLDDQMLFSDDGIDWTPVPSDTGLDGYRVFRSIGEWAVAGQSMWQNVGMTRDLLHSDGESWVKVDTSESWPDLPGTDDETFFADVEVPLGERLFDGHVVYTHFGYLASMGSHSDENEVGPHYTRIWISLDGTSWEEIQPIQEPDWIDIGGIGVGSVGDLIYVGAGGDDGVIRVGYIHSPDERP